MVTAEELLAAYQKKDQPRVTIVRAAELWHEHRLALVGKSITCTSYKDYRNKLGLMLFLRGQNLVQALPDQFTENFCYLFIIWMRSERGVSQNYTNKTVQVIKQFLKWCKWHKHAKTNLLESYSLRFEAAKAPAFLTSADIECLQQHPFASEPLRRVADVFLFQCYTGLAYADLKRFDATRDVGLGEDG